MEPSAQPSPTATPVPPATLPRLPLPRLGNTPTLREQGGDALALAGIAHDARNLVTALGLCAEMIGEPGVLAPHHGHFATEIRSITAASASLVERISGLARAAAQANPGQGTAVRAKETPVPETPVTDLSEAVRQMGSLLSAVAGPVTELQIACLPCRGQLRLSEESLSRILVNLVRNAADARPTGGRVRITTQRGGGESFLWTLEGETPGEQSAQYLWDDSPHPSAALPHTVLLTVEDDGPGIPTEFLERVFETGFTTRQGGRSWPEPQHHGLGLSIVRQLVDAAGGTVRAVVPPSGGGRFEIELPLTNVTPNLLSVLPVHGENEGQ